MERDLGRVATEVVEVITIYGMNGLRTTAWSR